MKVALFGGAGGVGASAAFNLLLDPAGHELVIVDSRPEMVVSHVMDFQQVLEQGGSGSVRAGDRGDLCDSDVIVVCASTAEEMTDSRLRFLERNAAIVRSAGEALGASWPGVVVMVTNPVDPLVTLFQQLTGIDRRRVIGYTLNDTLRLRTGIALALGIDAGRVDAWVVGEHGDSSVPLFTRVLVDGEPVGLSDDQQASAADFARGWFAKHKALDSGRSSTWTSGLGTARIVRAIANGGGERFPASMVLDGEYGIEGVSVSVPVTIGGGGVEKVHEWDLSPDEAAALRAAAECVRGVTARLNGAAR